MSSIIDDKNKTIYVVKESVGGENKVSNIIEKIILKDIKNNLLLEIVNVTINRKKLKINKNI